MGNAWNNLKVAVAKYTFIKWNALMQLIQLCAGRVGQLLNINSLAKDTGVSHTNIGSWLSVLEAS
jgi:predicted AAA+ superfamily ATPase